MRAVVCRGFGPHEHAVETVPAPALPPDGVRIQVRSIGVSFANLLVMAGKHQNRAEPPFTPGTEVSGTVIECGPEVQGLRPGQRVVAGLRTGGFADQAVAPVRTTFALPDHVDDDAAVQLPTIYGTAYAALVWRARLAAGETLLVHGAAGGSGLAAIEIGKVLGARVIATAGSEDKLAAARAHGADLALNYRNGPFRDAVLEATGGRGADVVFDPVGGAVFEESLRCTAPEGRLLPIGFAGGDIPQAPVNILLVKNLAVIGLYWGYYMGWARQASPPGMEAQVRAAFDTLFGWIGEGRLRPETHRAYPLEDYRTALELISTRSVIGKVVLHP